MAIYTYPLNSTTPVTIAAGADFATETTLAAFKTSLLAKDFSTETTLAAFKTSLLAKDFSTETTLAAFKTAFDALAKDTGASSAATLRSVLATRHEAVGTPISVRLGDGTDFITTGAIAAAQKTVATATKAVDTVSLLLGWDTVTHREILLDTTGAIRLNATDLISMKPEYARAIAPVLLNFATSGITASAYTQVIASTAAKATRWQFTNTSSSHITIATGAAASEVPFAIIPPGGAAEIDISIASSTRISVTSDENVNTGKFSVSAFV